MRRPVRPPCAGSPRSRRVARSDVARPSPPTRRGSCRGRPPAPPQPCRATHPIPSAGARRRACRTGRTRRSGSGSRRRPLILEQPVDDEVVEPTAPAPLAARDAVASESEALGDRAAPRVVRSGPDHDAVQAHLAEPDPDQRPDGARHQPAPLVPRRDPVADLGRDPVAVGHEAHSAHVRVVHEHAAALKAPLGRDNAFEPRALVLDRAGPLDPRHPTGQPIALGLHERPRLVQVVHREPSKDRAVAELDRQRAHDVEGAAFWRSSSARTRRRTLPTIVSGSASRNSTCLGARYAVSPLAGSRAQATISSVVALSPSFRTTNAFTASPVDSSGTPITAAFETFGWW